MKQHPAPLRRATALLLAAVALPLTPALAQDVQPAPATTPPPVYDSTPPAPAPTPAPAPIPTPAPIAVEAPAPAAEAPAPAPRAQAPARTTRAATRTAPARAAVRTAAPAAAAPAPAAVEPAPVAEAPAETAAVPELLPPPPPVAPAETVPPVEQSGANTTLWVVAGLLLLAALGALFLLLRRRRHDSTYDDYRSDAYAEPRYDTAMSSAAAMPEAAGIPVAAAPVVAAAAVTESGRPQLDFVLHPRRAGVTGDQAKVEFELEIDNQGNAAAQDVRISTWMLPAGGDSGEMENMLIVRHGTADAAELPAIPAGGEERISRSVQLSTSEVGGDAVLPVVVAEARYRLPDGSEARTTASFAVGVRDGEEFAHFAIDNPSGLHDGVEARQLGEPEHA